MLSTNLIKDRIFTPLCIKPCVIVYLQKKEKGPIEKLFRIYQESFQEIPSVASPSNDLQIWSKPLHYGFFYMMQFPEQLSDRTSTDSCF